MSKKKLSRQRIFEIIQIGSNRDIASRSFDFVIVFLILVNVVLAICCTFDELDKYDHLFYVIEGFTVICFCIELALRLWTADLLYKKAK